MSDVPEAPYNLVYGVVGPALYVLGIYKVRAYRRLRVPGLLVMAVATLAAGTSFLTAAPAIYRRVGDLGVSNLATLIVYTGITFFSVSAVSLALMWTPPQERTDLSQPWDRSVAAAWPQIRRHVLPIYLPALMAMAVLFLISDLPPGESPLTFDTTFANHTSVLLFLLIYQITFAYSLWTIGRVSWQRCAEAPGEVRRGLRSLSAGCAIISGYCLCKLIAIIGVAAGTHALDLLSTQVGPACASLGAVVQIAGWGGPSLRTWRQRRADYRDLHPLWRTALEVDPGLALDGPLRPWAERLASRDLEWRLTRRTREIRDAQLALQPWTDQAFVDDARTRATWETSDYDEIEVLVAAAALAIGLRARAADLRPAVACTRLPGMDVPPQEECRHLVRVAHAFNSPFVHRAVDQYEVTSTDAHT